MISRPLKKFRSVNSNASGFRALSSELDLSVVDAGTAAGRCLMYTTSLGGNGLVPEVIDLWPYGLGANNDTFDMRLVGWKRLLPLMADGRDLWVPSILGQVSVTLGNFTGIAGAPVLNTEYFADTIVKGIEPLKTANTTLLDGKILYYSPANDTPGHVMIPLQGFEVIELDFDQTLNTPTMNALFSFTDCH